MLGAWIVCIAGWVGVSLIPDNYESRAVLHVDTASMLRPLLADLAVDTNVMSEVRMMTEVLKSRPQLERVVLDTDLDLRASTPAEMEDLLASVRERIQVSGGSPRNSFAEQNLYTIRFSDKDPEIVFAVVQSLLDSFVELSLIENKADSAGAQEFIREQISEYENRLAQAEQELAEFKRKNVGLMPSEGQDYYQRLREANEELEELEEEQATLISRRNELQRQLDGEEPTFGLLLSQDTGSFEDTQVQGDVGALEAEMANLLLKYTEKHPKVVALQSRIDQIRNQQASAGSTEGAPTAPLDTNLQRMNSIDQNPVYQSLKIAMGEVRADLTEIREKISAARSRAEYLRSRMDAVPEIEAQLARLNRDYEVNKAQHTALLRRLESARLSEQAESRADDVKFRIIEPPLLPLQPTGPNRALFASAVLVAGLGIGGVIAFALNFLNPVFNAAHDLRAALGLPVLGSISVYENTAQRRAHRRDRRRFGFATFALIAAFAGAMAALPLIHMVRDVLVDGGLL